MAKYAHDTSGIWSPPWSPEPEVDRYSDGIYVCYNGPLPKKVKLGGWGGVLLQESGLRRVREPFRPTLTLYANCSQRGGDQ